MTTTITKEELKRLLDTEKDTKKNSTITKEANDIVQDSKPLFSVEQTIEPVKPDKRKKTRSITPTNAQDAVIRDIKLWYSSTPGYGTYELAGYAGVGKSTVVDIILEELDIDNERVRLCAPTGTASLVLKEKTPGYSCSTLHKLFYVPELTKAGRTIFVPSADNLNGTRLIIVDEGSMVGNRTANEILPMARKAGCKVIIVGDPGQLPPVKDEEYFFKNPNSILTEVLRQASDNPIIALSMAIRKATEDGVSYRFPRKDVNIGGKVYVIDRRKVSVNQYAKVVANGGVVIAGMNKTRQNLNQAIRSHLGFNSPTLMNGETIVIKENIDGGNKGEIAVTNGMRGKVSNVRRTHNGLIRFKFTPDAFEGYRYLEVQEDILFERKTMADIRKENYVRRSKGEREIQPGDEVQLGYVITGHSSQGSQWKTVYAIDESGVFGRGADGYKNQNRWLYTVVTRAIENLVVIR
ncbi:ATP-dependent RecD-like DNA helicase [Priestia megaterium]|uniref:ATP-dependent DNA helicase n=1 Tax=Priestia megaterium TaxID=1404 RepID=UPI00366D27D5